MSYAHTKRRKNIKRFKKWYPNAWRTALKHDADEIMKKNDGPIIGSLEKIIGIDYAYGKVKTVYGELNQ
jgi:hypothetical protein